MQQLSKEFLEKFPIRKTRYQKELFAAWVEKNIADLGYGVGIEEGGSFGSRNIVVGDPDSADFILTAHYDTPPVNLLPFLQMPQNIILSILYHLFRYGCMYLFSLAASILFFETVAAVDVLMYVVRYGLFLFLFFMSAAGIANRHNMNDNTSGVLELLELMQTLPEQQRDRVAFVLFDNAEKGLAGSQGFFVKHAEAIYDKLLINYDCLAAGDYIVLFAPKKYRRSNRFSDLMRGAFGSPAAKKFVFPFKLSLYLSDHIVFPRGVSVAAFHRRKLFGYCFGKIHTPFDKKLDERNIEVIREMTLNLVSGQSALRATPFSREEIDRIIKKPDQEKSMSSLEMMFKE